METNYEKATMDKQCSSCGGFCGGVCERENVEPIGEIIEAHGLIAVSLPEMPPVGTKLYAQSPKSQWVGLTTEQRNNIMQEHGNDWKRYTEEVERQIKENNGVLA